MLPKFVDRRNYFQAAMQFLSTFLKWKKNLRNECVLIPPKRTIINQKQFCQFWHEGIDSEFHLKLIKLLKNILKCTFLGFEGFLSFAFVNLIFFLRYRKAPSRIYEISSFSFSVTFVEREGLWPLVWELSHEYWWFLRQPFSSLFS